MRGLRVWVAVMALVASARAEPAADEVVVERFRVSLDDDGILGVNSGRVARHLEWGVSGWLSGIGDPVLLRRADGEESGALVARQVGLGLGATIGLWGVVEVGAAVPVIVDQSSRLTEMPPAVRPLPANGIGDARVLVKLRVVDRARLHVALMPALEVPVGAPGGYLREAPSLAPEALVSGHAGRVRWALNVGYRLRREVVIADRMVDDELFARLGGGMAFGHTEAALSLAGVHAIGDDADALEVMAGATHRFGALRVLLGGGMGVGHAIGSPDWRVIAGIRFGGGEAASPAPVAVREVPEMPPQVEPPLELPAALRVRVLDVAGVGIEGATVRVLGGGPAKGADRELITTADGSAEVVVLDAPGDITLVVVAKGYRDADKQVVVSRAAEPTGIDVTLERVPMGTIRGLVRGFDGKAVEGAQIKVAPAGLELLTDSMGVFEAELAPGEYQVSIYAPGFRAQNRTVRVTDQGVTVLNADLGKLKR